MKLRVIAEGVDTEKQLAFLKQSNCQEMQGYYFYKALPPDEMEVVLKNERK
jgi:EAL domain-containing protein (putative c-di-GMP-specific phosphodiesterase class I)